MTIKITKNPTGRHCQERKTRRGNPGKTAITIKLFIWKNDELKTILTLNDNCTVNSHSVVVLGAGKW